MTDNLKITSDQVQEISNLQGTPLYYSKYNENNFKHLIIPPMGGNQVTQQTSLKNMVGN